jgi:tripartite ATP-independent transporter DctM subunit
MSGMLLGILGLVVVLIALLLLKIPPGFVMAVVGFIGLAACTSWDAALTMIGSEFWGIFSRYGLTVIPMFIFVGELIYYAGYSDQLYHAAYHWFGHFRGGLAMSTVAASAGFSAICGSNTATAATMSAVAIPSMRNYHYHPVLMAGSVAAGSTLGVMIPPSIVLVVYGLWTSQSIGQLFFGALIPALLLAVLIGLTIAVICRRHPHWGPAGERSTWGERFRALWSVVDVALLFVVIMAALCTGMVTSTEAAALGCFLALVMCLLRRRLTWHKLAKASMDTLRISCMVMLIIAGATVFGRFMVLTGIPQSLAESIAGLQWPPMMILVMILLLFAVGGCLMDALAFLLVSLPIIFPLVKALGMDPVTFGVLVCLVTTLGAITPPIGICCFVIAGMNKDIKVDEAFHGAMYYLPAYVLTAIVVLFAPRLTVLMLAHLVP